MVRAAEPARRPAVTDVPAAAPPPRTVLKRLTGESIVYGFGQVLGRALQLVLVPVLTRVLAQDAYGVSDLVLAYLQVALLVLVFGMDGALARFYYHEPDDAARRRMVSSSLAFRLVSGTLAGAVIVALSGPIAGGLLGDDVYAKYVAIGGVTLPLTLVGLFANDVLRVTFQPWKFVTLNVVQTAVTAGVTLWLVLARELGVAGVFYGRLAGDAAAAALGLVLARHHLRPAFDRAILARMLAYGTPLVPAAFAFGLIGSVDRWALQRFAGLHEVAVYAVAIKFFAVVTMGVAAFQLAWFPFAYQRARDPGAPDLFARVAIAYLALATAGAVAVGLLAPEVLALAVPPEYARAAEPALWLAFAAVLQGAYYVASLGIGLALRTPLLGVVAGAGAAVAAVANLMLVPRLGASGAAIATLLGSLAAAAAAYAVAQRVHPLPHRGGLLAALFAAGLGIAVLAQAVAPAGVSGLAIRVAAIAAYAAVAVRVVLGLRVRGSNGG